MYHLLYVSRLVLPHPDGFVTSILFASRRNNAKLDVTGCLLYSGRFFAQLLEGDETVVRALAARIEKDARHIQVKIAASGHSAKRRYESWSMGYLHDLGLEDAIEALVVLPGLPSSPAQALGLLERMHPDSVMGGL